ncbi:stressosome-associated protein Prli42 [Alkalihalobacillus sp. AL-G]|nr:stressosome-associated protein Prli42 [Alkalihalobacillus sp. AL-G]WLD91958.1 stressosome-associated protein Prli42 [Alkalihalobacillus sp. AL-G]
MRRKWMKIIIYIMIISMLLSILTSVAFMF